MTLQFVLALLIVLCGGLLQGTVGFGFGLLVGLAPMNFRCARGRRQALTPPRRPAA